MPMGSTSVLKVPEVPERKRVILVGLSRVPAKVRNGVMMMMIVE